MNNTTDARTLRLALNLITAETQLAAGAKRAPLVVIGMSAPRLVKRRVRKYGNGDESGSERVRCSGKHGSAARSGDSFGHAA